MKTYFVIDKDKILIIYKTLYEDHYKSNLLWSIKSNVGLLIDNTNLDANQFLAYKINDG